MIDQIDIYTDGSGTNSGPIGWGFAVLVGSELIYTDCGGDTNGTCNLAEIRAAIAGLEWAQANYPAYQINVYSDSEYVVRAFKDGWIANWMRNKWKNGRRRKVANKEWWLQLQELVDNLDVKWYHVRGHTGIEPNELADSLAKKGRQQVICGLPKTSGA